MGTLLPGLEHLTLTSPLLGARRVGELLRGCFPPGNLGGGRARPSARLEQARLGGQAAEFQQSITLPGYKASLLFSQCRPPPSLLRASCSVLGTKGLWGRGTFASCVSPLFSLWFSFSLFGLSTSFLPDAVLECLAFLLLRTRRRREELTGEFQSPVGACTSSHQTPGRKAPRLWASKRVLAAGPRCGLGDGLGGFPEQPLCHLLSSQVLGGHSQLSPSQPHFSALPHLHPSCHAKPAPTSHLNKLIEVPLLKGISLRSSLLWWGGGIHRRDHWCGLLTPKRGAGISRKVRLEA